MIAFTPLIWSRQRLPGGLRETGRNTGLHTPGGAMTLLLTTRSQVCFIGRPIAESARFEPGGAAGIR
jgi:hypothetical protein